MYKVLEMMHRVSQGTPEGGVMEATNGTIAKQQRHLDLLGYSQRYGLISSHSASGFSEVNVCSSGPSSLPVAT
jgi:hypothetical protein